MEYAYQISHTSLTKGQSTLLEFVQKSTMNIIKPSMKYVKYGGQ